jgi:hypothetical protein
MFKIDIDCLSNGKGKVVYGDKLEAYSFYETTCELWFEKFTNEVIAAIGKKYYPVYRLADGELRFLFGPKIHWKNKTLKSILSYAKYGIFKASWKTSWGEKYNSNELNELRNNLIKCIFEISQVGKLAIYWNENGLNAFTEYNRSMQNLFLNINITLDQNNYIPFHFGQALIAKNSEKIFKGKNILFVSGLSQEEFIDLQNNIISFGAKSVSLLKCSATSALAEDYTKAKTDIAPDIIFVAAGIGAAKALFGLRHFQCPVIDIGGYIHVLSGKLKEVHAGFFIYPIK